MKNDLTAGRVARRLLAFYKNDPARWTQRTFTRDVTGKPVSLHSGLETCWCAWGALERIIPQGNSARVYEALNVLEEKLGDSLPRFNDACPSFDEFKKKLHEIARTP